MVDYNDLQNDYKYFIEYVSYTSSLNEYLILNIHQFLSEYYKLENYDETFADNLELILANIESYYILSNYATEYIKEINLPILKLIHAEIINFDNCTKIPNNYDIDIYTDFNNLPYYLNILKKSKLRIILNNNSNNQ